MRITVIADDTGNIVGSVVSSRGPVARMEPMLPAEEHPVLDRVESEDGHTVLEVTAPKELAEGEPGPEHVKLLRGYRVKDGKLVPKKG